MACDYNVCGNPALFRVVYGCLEGHLYDHMWCGECMNLVMDKVDTHDPVLGSRWVCEGWHTIADLIYQPINFTDYVVNGKRQMYDHKGLLVA